MDRRLDTLAGSIATPITTRRGLLARLHYLTRTDLTRTDDARTDHARQTARGAGLTVTDRTLKALLDGKRSLNQSQVDRPRRRVVSFRTLNVRHWDRIVEARAAADEQALDEAWVSDATSAPGRSRRAVPLSVAWARMRGSMINTGPGCGKRCAILRPERPCPCRSPSASPCRPSKAASPRRASLVAGATATSPTGQTVHPPSARAALLGLARDGP